MEMSVPYEDLWYCHDCRKWHHKDVSCIVQFVKNEARGSNYPDNYDKWIAMKMPKPLGIKCTQCRWLEPQYEDVYSIGSRSPTAQVWVGMQCSKNDFWYSDRECSQFQQRNTNPVQMTRDCR
jgi:hypothetical protein